MKADERKVLAQADFGGLRFTLTEDETDYIVIMEDTSKEGEEPTTNAILNKKDNYEMILGAFIQQCREHVDELISKLLENIQEG